MHRHTPTRPILNGNPLFLMQAAMEEGLSIEVILWYGLIVKRITDRKAEEVPFRKGYLSTYFPKRWSEETWQKLGFCLEWKINHDYHQAARFQREERKLIP